MPAGASVYHRGIATAITPPDAEGRIRVRDGRKLGYATFGPADGRPILWLHGTPGARRQIPEDARLAAEEAGVRFIGIDRPGTGLSTSHLYDSVLDFTTDLQIVLEEMGVDELAVIGLSGGGPYALAAAYAMPSRVKVVGVLGGVAPSQGPEGIDGGLVSVATRFASVLPPLRVPLGALLSGLILILRPVGHYGLVAFSKVSPPGDAAVLQRPEIEAMFLDDITDTGGRLRAPVDDAILFTRDWGFSLTDVNVPVKWWHGDADHIVPLAHGAHCVKLLPDAELFVRPTESHLGGLGAAKEVLDVVLAAWDRPPARASG